MPTDALIFDMDGVLVDSEPLHLEAANEILGREGASLSEEQNRPYLGTNEATYWRALIERFGLAETVEHYVGERHRALVRRLVQALPMSAGVVELVHALRARGVPLAVASSSDRALIDHVLAGSGLDVCFPVVVSGDEVVRPKPDPEIYLRAAERLGVAPAHCVALEDSVNGVRSARAAGMRVLRVKTATTAMLAFPPVDGEIDSFARLDVDALLNLARGTMRNGR